MTSREQYQDLWIRGESTAPGVRECAARYEAIRPVLAGYSRPFTLLDLGAAQGYFSFRALEDFPGSVAVMVDDDPRLPGLCRENAAPGSVLLHRLVTVADLEALAACEHFDVVLALNVLHHFDDWQRAWGAVTRLGDRLIVEMPHSDDEGACGQATLAGLNAALRTVPTPRRTLLAETPSHTDPDRPRPVYCVETPKRSLSRAYFDAPDSETLGENRIEATADAKRITFERKGVTRRWLPGINLRTYQALGGAWPEPETVAAWVESAELPEGGHGDLRPWNLILDGRTVTPIDGRDEDAGKAVYADRPSRDLTAAEIRSGAVVPIDDWKRRNPSLLRGLQVAVLTPFRNARAHLPTYFRQVRALEAALPSGTRLRLVAAEGDSADGTRSALEAGARAAGLQYTHVATDHGGLAWGSVEDPVRLRTMSSVMNAALGQVTDGDDVVLWIMSDLEWEPGRVADLVVAARDGRDGYSIFAPDVRLPDGRFYDTWAYRDEAGERLTPEWTAPGSDPVPLSSAGTCLAMPAAVARDFRARELEAVSFCLAARDGGHRVAMLPECVVTHGAPAARRLLWVGDAVAPTGFARCTHACLPALAEAGWDLDVVGINYHGAPHSYPYRIWPATVVSEYPMGEKRLYMLLQAADYDAVVLLTDPWNVPGYLKAYDAAFDDDKHRERNRPPVLAWFGVDAANNDPANLEGLSAVAAWTEFTREQFAAWDGPISLAPLGVDTATYRPLDRARARRHVWPDTFPADAFIVGSVGRAQYRKRHDLLLAAFAEWTADGSAPDAYLYLHAPPSDGDGCDVASLVRYFGLRGRVAISTTANLNDQTLAVLYNAFDLYATTTQGEGWGLPVLEAMACGVPCVVPRWSGLSSWVPEDGAVMVECRSQAPNGPRNRYPYTMGGVVDPADMAESLAALYGDADRRRALALRGPEIAAGLSWGDAAEALVGAVEAMVEGRTVAREGASGG